MPLQPDKTREEINRGFYVLGMDTDTLSEEQKALLPGRLLKFKANEGVETIATFLKIRLPLDSHEVMLAHASLEFHKSEQAFVHQYEGTKALVKVIDWIVNVFFSKRLWRTLVDVYSDGDVGRFSKDTYASVFKKRKYAYPDEVDRLGMWDSFFFIALQRRILYVRYVFYRKCLEILQAETNSLPQQTFSSTTDSLTAPLQPGLSREHILDGYFLPREPGDTLPQEVRDGIDGIDFLEHDASTMLYFRFTLPIAPADKMLAYAEAELDLTDQIVDEHQLDTFAVRFRYSLYKVLYRKRAENLIKKLHNPGRYSPEWVLEQEYYYWFIAKGKKQYWVNLDTLSTLDATLYRLFWSRKLLLERAEFYADVVEELSEKITPTYRDHRPPRNLNDWLYQIDAVREEYKSKPLDV